jgi:hypothetical protein
MRSRYSNRRRYVWVLAIGEHPMICGELVVGIFHYASLEGRDFDVVRNLVFG